MNISTLDSEVHLFKALADGTRLRLACILAVCGEVCVCDLSRAIEEPDYKVSRHLSVLRSIGMVQARREGTWMHYKLVEPRTVVERELQSMLKSSLCEHEMIANDIAGMKDRAICSS